MDLLTDNPIFIRELRRRMRGRGLVVTLCLYIAAMCLWALLTVQWQSEMVSSQSFGARTSTVQLGGPSYVTATSIGRSLFSSIVAIQAILVLIVAPTITAAMVRSEKERQTFDFLRGTAISAPTYVVGALLSTVLYVALALLCALPVLMVSHLYGGVSDVVRTTLALLGASILLSSGGLLVSCATERGRTGHLLLGLLLAGGLGLYAGSPSAGSWSSLIGAAGAQPGSGLVLAGLQIPGWVVSACLCIAVSGVLLLIASRKLFQPRERALNYRQMAAVYFGALSAAGVWLLTGKNAAAAQAAAGAANPRLLLERGGLLMAVLVGIGILIQCTALLSRVEIGNERWRIKQNRPALEDRDEAGLFVAAVTIPALLLAGAFVLAAWPGEWGRLAALLPPAFFLAAHAGLCRLLMKRGVEEYAALRVVLAVDLLLLVVPAVLIGLTAGWGAGAAGSRSMVMYAGIVSPVESAVELLRWGLSLKGMLHVILAATLAVGTWALSGVAARRSAAAGKDEVNLVD